MARAALRLGVRDVAKMSGVSPTTIGQIERERTVQPEPATLEALRAAFEREGIVFQDDGSVKLGRKPA